MEGKPEIEKKVQIDVDDDLEAIPETVDEIIETIVEIEEDIGGEVAQVRHLRMTFFSFHFIFRFSRS